jgi:P27 family predicted phage terminase small subunit
MRGRKPAPTALKLVRGDHKERINDDEPQPAEGVPTCPSRNPAVRAVWDYTLAQLLVMRTITMADRDALHAYCQAVVLFERATAILEQEGLTMPAMSGRFLPHPAQKIQREAGQQLRMYACEFGLTPSARTRIRVGDQAPKSQEQGAARLLSG